MLFLCLVLRLFRWIPLVLDRLLNVFVDGADSHPIKHTLLPHHSFWSNDIMFLLFNKFFLFLRDQQQFFQFIDCFTWATLKIRVEIEVDLFVVLISAFSDDWSWVVLQGTVKAIIIHYLWNIFFTAVFGWSTFFFIVFNNVVQIKLLRVKHI